MDDPSYYLILAAALFALLGLSFFCSLCETGFTSLSRIKLKNMAEKDKHDGKSSQTRRAKRAEKALKLLDSYDKLLSSILIGNTLANVAASSLAALLFISLLRSNGVTVSTVVITLAVLIFCEIAPKTLAKASPELTALRVAPFLSFFIVILTPFSRLAAAWQKIIVKIFPPKEDRSTTEDELLTFVGEVRQEGGINIQEEHMIRQVIEFDELKASEIFTPRVDVEAVSQDASVEEIDKKFIETGFSRLPVFQDTLDNITGIIILKDFYHEVMTGLKTPAQVVKPVFYVHKTIKIAKLLKTMQGEKAHLAVVIDEHGGTLGIVTVEDIVEELVGEIWDEHDEVVEPVKKQSGGGFTVLGSVNFADMLEKITEGKIPDIDEIPNTTVANWTMETLGRLPRTGEKLKWNFLTVKVSRVIKHRVMEVDVSVDCNL
jgi:CBS domain containing-hemolysin-like protein